MFIMCMNTLTFAHDIGIIKLIVSIKQRVYKGGGSMYYYTVERPMNDTTENSGDKFEITKSVSAEEKRQMETHENFSESGIIADASYEAWDDLSEKHREQVDWADENLPDWTPGDHHLELSKHRVSQNKVKYLKNDIYGLTKEDREKLKKNGRFEDFKEAIREWHGKQLTAQLEMTEARE